MQLSMILLCSLLVGCTTAVVPQGMKIKTTENPTDVENCVVVGAVEAHPPYVWPGDDIKQLKNKAVLLGADTVFVTGRFGTVLGMAYVCNKKKSPLSRTNNGVNESDLYSQLIKLKKLLDDGILTQEEFNQQKNRLLNPSNQ